MSETIVSDMKEEEMKGKETETWHKPKNGSVFPPKRRSVKKMIWDHFKLAPFSSSNTVSSPSHSNTVHPHKSYI